MTLISSAEVVARTRRMCDLVRRDEMPLEAYLDWCLEHLNCRPTTTWHCTRAEWFFGGPHVVAVCPIRHLVLTDLKATRWPDYVKFALFDWGSVRLVRPAPVWGGAYQDTPRAFLHTGVIEASYLYPINHDLPGVWFDHLVDLVSPANAALNTDVHVLNDTRLDMAYRAVGSSRPGELERLAAMAALSWAGGAAHLLFREEESDA